MARRQSARRRWHCAPTVAQSASRGPCIRRIGTSAHPGARLAPHAGPVLLGSAQRTLAGPVVGTGPVDPTTGAWTVKVTNNVALDPSRTVSIESKLGGVLLAVPINVTN
jgi:hypothetical protein